MATELVVAVPALLLMVLLIVQATVYAHARHVAQAVAAHTLETARALDGTEPAARTAGQELLAQLGPALTRPILDVHRGPDRATVTLTGTAQTVLPGLHLTITVHDNGPVEQLPPASNR